VRDTEPRYRRPATSSRASLGPVLGLFVAALVCGGALFLLPKLTPFSLVETVIGAFDTPASADATPVRFSVREGESAGAIGDRLQASGLVGSSEVFRLLVGYYGAGGKLQAGEYELRHNMRPSEIIAALGHGLGSSRLVTVPEGRRTEEVAAILAENQVVPAESFLAAAHAGDYHFDFLEGLPPDAPLEGFLFPDSYRFDGKATPRETVQKMLEAFDQRAGPDLRRGGPGGLGGRETVILASIVEREAVLSGERPVIAAVYLNRLRQGIRLDADPTVQYALTADPGNVVRFGWWKQNLLLADLEVASPYNTYRQTGLPPGPIANPGLSAIQAVLYPAKNDYLYFVAKPDGSHLFARTLDEHNANVRRVRQ
jgi:UPF0755 protein